MEELKTSEIFAGLTNPSYQTHKVVLLQLMANKFAEENQNEIKLNDLLEYLITDINQQYITYSKTKTDTLASVINCSYLVLQNITSYEDNCKSFINMITDSDSNYNASFHTTWTSLLNSFLNYDPLVEQYYQDTLRNEEVNNREDFYTLKDPLQNMSSILCNLSRYVEYREQFLKRSLNYIPRLLTQVS